MDLVVPFGFYGWGNIGDESTLQGFARLISHYHPEMHVWVASRNPSHTARVEPTLKYFKAVGRDPRKWWARYRSAGQLVAGGTPIMDVLGAWPLSEVAPLVSAAHHQRKPIVFVGAGTEKLQREESRRVVSEVLAPKVLHWSARSERDKERLIDYGVLPERVAVAADLAWTLEKISRDFGETKLIELGLSVNSTFVGVNVNNESSVLAQEPRLFEKIGGFLDSLVEYYDVQILFLCNEVRDGDTYDKTASRKIINYMKHKHKAFQIPNHYWTPQQMLSLIACCCITISMRYHFCLFSALQNIPFIAIERSDKVSDLCYDMNWIYSATLANLSSGLLFNMFSEIYQRRTELVDFLKGSVELMRARATQNNLVLDILLKHLKQ